MRGNRSSKPTFLDEIDDPHGELIRAGAAGYDRAPEYPWTWDDVRRHEARVKGLELENANPERASSSSVPRQGSSSLSPPDETNKRVHTCEHGVKVLKPRKIGKKRNLDETDEMEARKRIAEAWSLNMRWEKR